MSLIVYLNETRAGRLEEDSGLMLFSYDEAWLKNPTAIPLSRSLPLQSETFTGKESRAFFAGILPEEEPRRKIASILGISNTNDFAMLERIGGECAGAVSLLPENQILPHINIQREKLTDNQLRKLIIELPKRPLMADMDGLRLSLAGAQDKLPVIVDDDGIALPLGNAPSTHILKPEPDRFSGLAANEFFCMTLAKNIGLNTASISYRLIGEKPCVLIQRYDRVIDEKARMTRLHQEDFCQALGFPPERKYEAEHGPCLNDCINLMQEWSTAPVIDIPHFIDAQIFNVLIGNGDAHSKNYSFLYADGERRLSPLYDLVCTLAWPELSKNLAMKIGNCKSVSAFTLGDWQKMAKKTSLAWPMIRERIQASCQKIADHIEEVRKIVQPHNEYVALQLYDIISDRSNKMNEALKSQ